MDINWIDHVPGSTDGTPVDRPRLMGMQGYFPGDTTIEKVSAAVTRITETSAEGTTVTTITKSSSSTTIARTFTPVTGDSITKTTTITKSGDTTSITETLGS